MTIRTALLGIAASLSLAGVALAQTAPAPAPSVTPPPAAAPAPPAKAPKAAQQPRTPEDRRIGEFGLHVRGQQISEERQLVELGQFRLVERHGGANADIAIGLHDSIDHFGRRVRYEEGVVLY